MEEYQQSDVTIATNLVFAKEKKKKNQNEVPYTAQISETITKKISRKVEKGKGSVLDSGISEFSYQVKSPGLRIGSSCV